MLLRQAEIKSLFDASRGDIVTVNQQDRYVVFDHTDDGRTILKPGHDTLGKLHLLPVFGQDDVVIMESNVNVSVIGTDARLASVSPVLS